MAVMIQLVLGHVFTFQRQQLEALASNLLVVSQCPM